MGKMTKYEKEEIEIKSIIDNPITMDALKGKNIIYGTFGKHASEKALKILTRKVNEPKESEEGWGLWGVSIAVECFDTIRRFCAEQNGDVYLLLAYTGSENNSDPILYNTYIDENGKPQDIPKRIEVKGSDNQNVAFKVSEYFFLEDNFNRNELLNCYTGVYCTKNCIKEPYKEAVELTSNFPHYLLKAKPNAVYPNAGKKDRFGIVLKLQAPYIVEVK